MGSLSAVYSTFVFVLVLSVSEAEDKYNCSAVRGCVSDIIGYVLTIPTILGDEEIANERNFGELCRKTEIATKCIREHKDECKSTSVLKDVDELNSEVVYLCRKDIRAETLAMFKLDCYKNEELRERVRDGIGICNTLLMESESAVDCELENERAECIIRVVKHYCGADYVRYVIRRETDALRDKLCSPLIKV